MSYVENGVLYLDVSIQTEKYIDINIDTDSKELDFTLEGSPDPRLPYYDGAYEVDPRKVEQILETANKSMAENVKVNPIFYAETSNESGGYTAIIGLE